jgi:dTDP-4-amino-4,6-dideoxygalactose transaminase
MHATTLTYQVFDPTDCAFPAPRVALLPVFDRDAFGSATGRAYRRVGAGRPQRCYTRGRYALADAYRLCGVGPEGGLLAPAYHCRTMIDPAISLGAPLQLYPLDERLVPDLQALQRLLAQAARPVRALLLTHYFGIPQQVAPVKALCDEHGVALIEDCSHALFNPAGAERVGAHGRYAIASPYKLLPCEEGGLLIAGSAQKLPPLRRAGPRAELRTLAHAVEHARGRNVREVPAVEQLDAELAPLRTAAVGCGHESRQELAGTSALYDRHEEGLAASLSSRLLARLCDTDRLAERRRANYRRWLDAVRGLPQCRPLFDPLPDGAVPYMFALLIDQPRTQFFLLKRLGVPIWRWDDMADSACPVSRHYRQHVLHLPCHQALTDAQMHWMTAAVAKVMHLGAARAVPEN